MLRAFLSSPVVRMAKRRDQEAAHSVISVFYHAATVEREGSVSAKPPPHGPGLAGGLSFELRFMSCERRKDTKHSYGGSKTERIQNRTNEAGANTKKVNPTEIERGGKRSPK